MNQNLNIGSEEKNIRKLFDEMRAADDQIAPSFSAVLQSTSKAHYSVRIGGLLPIVAAIMILIFAGVGAMVYFRKPDSPRTVIQEIKKEQVANSQPAPNEPQKSVQQPAPRRVGYRPRIKAPRRTNLLISQWRSPTEFLLRTPGNEFLRTIPRLDDSRVKINSAMPNDLN